MGYYNKNYGGAAIYVDISDLKDKITSIKNTLNKKQFETVLRRTFNEAGRKVKTIVRREVPKQYSVKASWAGEAVGKPEKIGGGQIGVVIPIKGVRGSIGGTFATAGSATNITPGGAYGTSKKKGYHKLRGKRAAKIRAKIYKGQLSTMPGAMKHQGGNPPFLAKGIAFTRKTDKDRPIVRVVGLSVPQMPLNKSKDDIEREIVAVVENRLQHNFDYLMRNIK